MQKLGATGFLSFGGKLRFIALATNESEFHTVKQLSGLPMQSRDRQLVAADACTHVPVVSTYCIGIITQYGRDPVTMAAPRLQLTWGRGTPAWTGEYNLQGPIPHLCFF